MKILREVYRNYMTLGVDMQMTCTIVFIKRNSPNVGSMKDKTELFIEKAISVHGSNYDYSKSKYIMSKSKVVITCPKHGDFNQTPNSHTNGQGCPKCGHERRESSKRLTIDDFMSRSIEAHGSIYDYSKVKFNSVEDSVLIKCPNHGYFEQVAINHYRGQGCPKCGVIRRSNIQRTSVQKFIDKSRLVHGDKYTYENIHYLGYRFRVIIGCRKHGLFKQTPDNHMQGAGCPSCGSVESRNEKSIYEMIKSILPDTVKCDRSLIKPYELDIYIPSKKVAIEYNGLRWHTEEFGKDKNYHINKSKMCAEKGVRLIHIWEDDYKLNSDHINSFIFRVLGLDNTPSIYARNTVFANPSKKEMKDFLNQHHVQGYVNHSDSVCLCDARGELVSVTLFTRRGYGFELVRHASKTVIGSLGKATSRFHKSNDGVDIFTFCDTSMFSGESYVKSGFVVVGRIKPDYKYVIKGVREHKFLWRKSNIKNKLPHIYDESLTESEMMSNAGINKVWDCGKLKFKYLG